MLQLHSASEMSVVAWTLHLHGAGPQEMGSVIFCLCVVFVMHLGI